MGKAQHARLAPVGLASLALVLTACGACERKERPADLRRAPPAGPTFERALCEAACARSIRCDGPRNATCSCGAIDDSGLLRADWAEAEIRCLAQTPCATLEACETEAYRTIGAAPLAWPPVVMRCFQRGDTCGGSSVTCRRLAAMSDDARAEVGACLELPCEAYAACLRSFFATRVGPEVPPWR